MQRRIGLQLCHALLTLALVSVPLTPTSAPRTQSLLPLRTSFVPFDASLELPTTTVVQFSVAASSTKRAIFAPLANSLPIPHHQVLSHDPATGQVCQFEATGLPGARSPPVV
jgi:hypothetical protein